MINAFKKYSLIVPSICVFLLLCSCGSSDSGSIDSSAVLYVDPVNGIDKPDSGTQIKPFKSITYTITSILILNSSSVQFDIGLLSGTYDSLNGEVFPIRIPDGISIGGNIINEANGQAAVIRSTDSETAIIVGGNTRINSLIVESPNGIAIYEDSDNSSVSITNSIIRNSGTGVVLRKNSKSTLKNNEIHNNLNIGIEILDFSSPVLIRNNIHSNTVGILVDDNANPAMNRITSSGGNFIQQNTSCDFRFIGVNNLNLIGNYWDADVLDFNISSVCADGANITNEGIGSIEYQFIPPENLPLFAGTDRINLTSPSSGQILISNQPEFSWIGKGSNLVMMAVWDQLPEISNGKINNISNIQWLWHSGLGTGLNGYVQYSDGVSIVDNMISNTASPVPLELGRSYYWAVWEWTEDGQSLLSSSNISYFHVSN